MSFSWENITYYYKTMPRNYKWKTICCKQLNRCICKEKWEEWEAQYNRRIKTHHLYCICNQYNPLFSCPVKNHKKSNPQVNEKIIYLLKSEMFPLEIEENIIKKLNIDIYFEEHHKALERQKELDEITRYVSNEYY